MLSKFFQPGVRVRALRSGPSGALLDGFAETLAKAGYAEISARRHLRAAEHFLSWADGRKIAVARLSPQDVHLFARHLPRCRCRALAEGTRGFGRSDRSLAYGASLLVRYLQQIGAVEARTVATAVAAPAVLGAFRAWMRQQRGTCETTLDLYDRPLRALLTRVGEDPTKLDARTIREFVIEGAQTSGWAAAKKRTTALRMFLRFLIAEGK